MNALIRCLAAVAVVLTLGLTSQSVQSSVRYHVSFEPLNSSPGFFSGNMLLDFNKGTISGTYNDTSIRPRGPLNNRRNVPVTGGLNENGHIQLLIGGLSFRGTMNGEAFSGTATAGSRVFTFRAGPGWPGQPAQ